MTDVSSPDRSKAFDRFRRGSRTWLAVATLIAVVATAGSLYLSLGLGLVPCRLCWYQRILMYPLVIVLGIASFENRRGVFRTALPLSTLGGGIAAYHSMLQVSAATGGACTLGGGGCGTIQLRVLGLSIPNLSLLAFALITTAMLVLAVRSSD
ncbi:disulfide bond formation protein B [Halorhabdus amylolytica]|uniref:disulfide bond formation protein B n=1 Tax=Halorhabdus amylolytica TaxID=2559573 RepID=UPI0010A9EE5D|nr:disulfide bond formation protein B [Halorhabdus amylolytica]